MARLLTAAVILGAVVASGCDHNNNPPTTPTPPGPATRAVVVVASTKVTGERRTEGGYLYRTVVHLTETAGVTANIASVSLTFLNGNTALLTSRFDLVVPSTGNTCPARTSVDTRELVSTDGDATHAFATSVRVEVTYSDSTSTGMTATGTGDVPPLGPAPPPRYTLTGVISDQGGAGITNARVEVLNGDNAGNATTTNSSGAYTLTDLLGGTFRVRASAPGYTTGEQNVTVPDVPRADFTLPRTPTTANCVYTLSATGRINVSFGTGQIGLTVTRTSGDCSWQATTDVGWLTPISATGNGTSNVTYTYASNTSFVGRLGTITFTWNGGTAQLQVVQDPEPASFCVVTLSVNGQNPLNNVPAAGSPPGSPYTLNITPVPGMPPGLCSSWTASVTPPLAIVGASSGPLLPTTLNFSVAANPGPPARSGLITVTTGSGGSATLTVNQVAGP